MHLKLAIPPLDVRHFEYYQGVNTSYAHRLGPWRQHFDGELRLCQNHWKIIGKPRSRASVQPILFRVLDLNLSDIQNGGRPGGDAFHKRTGWDHGVSIIESYDSQRGQLDDALARQRNTSCETKGMNNL